MDEQEVQVRKDLQNQFGSRGWRLNLRAGPECVLILAECLLLISKPEAMALDLSDPPPVRACIQPVSILSPELTHWAPRAVPIQALATFLGEPSCVLSLASFFLRALSSFDFRQLTMCSFAVRFSTGRLRRLHMTVSFEFSLNPSKLPLGVPCFAFFRAFRLLDVFRRIERLFWEESSSGPIRPD
jgi:hypothetical protein